MTQLMTPAGEALTGTPWTVYPRPQMRRESYINLNGTWDFSGEDPDAAFSLLIKTEFSIF